MTTQELQDKIKPYLKDDVLSEDSKVWDEISQDVEKVVNASINGVIENKEKILGEKKKLSEELDKIREKAQPFLDNGVSYDQFKEAQAELEELKAKGLAGAGVDINKIQTEFYEQGKKQMQQELTPKLKEFEEAQKLLEKQKEDMYAKYRKTLKRNALEEALSGLNLQVDSYWKDGFYAQADDEYIEAEDKVVIQVPNPIEPDGPKIPLNDWKKLFPQSELGKKLIKAPASNGSSSVGSDGKPTGNQDIGDYMNNMFGGRR